MTYKSWQTKISCQIISVSHLSTLGKTLSVHNHTKKLKRDGGRVNIYQNKNDQWNMLQIIWIQTGILVLSNNSNLPPITNLFDSDCLEIWCAILTRFSSRCRSFKLFKVCSMQVLTFTSKKCKYNSICNQLDYLIWQKIYDWSNSHRVLYVPISNISKNDVRFR